MNWFTKLTTKCTGGGWHDDVISAEMKKLFDTQNTPDFQDVDFIQDVFGVMETFGVVKPNQAKGSETTTKNGEDPSTSRRHGISWDFWSAHSTKIRLDELPTKIRMLRDCGMIQYPTYTRADVVKMTPNDRHRRVLVITLDTYTNRWDEEEVEMPFEELKYLSNHFLDRLVELPYGTGPQKIFYFRWKESSEKKYDPYVGLVWD